LSAGLDLPSLPPEHGNEGEFFSLGWRIITGSVPG